jgi:hypothetical protein
MGWLVFALFFISCACGLIYESLEYVRKAYQLDSEDPDVIDGYARVEYLSGNRSEARSIVLKGGRCYEGNAFFEQFRAVVMRELSGLPQQALLCCLQIIGSSINIIMATINFPISERASFHFALTPCSFPCTIPGANILSITLSL